MMVDVKTPKGAPMSANAATAALGSSLRIAPEFVATHANEETGVETTIKARYIPNEGRYIATTIVNRALREEFDDYALRHSGTQAIMQAAIPHCIAVQLGEDDGAWVTVADLTSNEGRILPPWIVNAVVKRGTKDERHDAVEIVYGASALADLPPVKAIALELGVPHRTASDWIKKARAAGRLSGMSYIAGRQADS